MSSGTRSAAPLPWAALGSHGQHAARAAPGGAACRPPPAPRAGGLPACAPGPHLVHEGHQQEEAHGEGELLAAPAGLRGRRRAGPGGEGGGKGQAACGSMWQRVAVEDSAGQRGTAGGSTLPAPLPLLAGPVKACQPGPATHQQLAHPADGLAVHRKRLGRAPVHVPEAGSGGWSVRLGAVAVLGWGRGLGAGGRRWPASALPLARRERVQHLENWSIRMMPAMALQSCSSQSSSSPVATRSRSAPNCSLISWAGSAVGCSTRGWGCTAAVLAGRCSGQGRAWAHLVHLGAAHEPPLGELGRRLEGRGRADAALAEPVLQHTGGRGVASRH
jgi:hypothetical protein